jgi:molybdopterin converting factor small subunit
MSSPPSVFTILYFAAASSYTGLESEKLTAPLPLSKLFATLEARYAGMTAKVLTGCAVTINLEYADVPESGEDEVMIQAGDEVGVIPPVSSGWEIDAFAGSSSTL